MSDEPKKRSRGWIIWVLIAGLVLYPLSMPPVLKMAIDHNHFGVVSNLYLPIFWVMSESQAVRSAIDWYSASCWGIVVGPDGPP
jgi:hypothetical protein